MDKLGDENDYLNSKITVVCIRQGERTLIVHENPQHIIFTGTKSGIIEMADRIFKRF